MASMVPVEFQATLHTLDLFGVSMTCAGETYSNAPSSFFFSLCIYGMQSRVHEHIIIQIFRSWTSIYIRKYIYMLVHTLMNGSLLAVAMRW